MKMIGNNVLISEVQKDNTSAGGIILTDTIDKASKPGLVLAVSTEALGPLMSGQRVFLDWSKSMPVNVDGKAAVIIDAEHIKAIISEE
jgi:co-chaperonin GroES (HSP10)|tara:strand:- start:1027 stop:1290 length:264 start_codon:yes stop_codon:yes gene_type:complete